MHFKIRKGLDIPLSGRPEQVVSSGNDVKSVAVLGSDYLGLKPRLLVREDERVRLGQPLVADKSNPGVHLTSPGSGFVTAIRRGERRVLLSIQIQLDGDDEEHFESYPDERIPGLGRAEVRENLLASGLWTALRCRPFSRIPAPDSSCAALFVTAIDTNPLAPDPAVIINASREAFHQGLTLLATLTEGPVYLCSAAGSDIECPQDKRFRHARFSGPHPAGLAGTHIHFLEPVSKRKTVWHIGYQDVIAVGRLFATGRLPVERVVALAGPSISRPRLVQSRLGANTSDLVRGEAAGSDYRVISGSVLSGHRAVDWAAALGRYHQQICVLQEGQPREFFGWMMPGLNKFSATRSFAGHLLHRGTYPLTTGLNGSPRAMVSIGSFESVMPLDILPTPLLKALLVDDTETAQQLGCLELDEEDLALCSFVCNGKYDYGQHLRRNLNEIEANG